MELAYSTEVLNSILNALTIRVFWKDLDGVYLGCNQIFCDDDGQLSIEDIVGKNDYDLQATKEQAEKYRSDDFEVITTGRPKFGIIEEFIGKHSLERRWLRTNKIPLIDEEGVICGVIGTYEEITPIIEAESRNLSLHKELLYKASHDYLTGLFNRQEFEQQLISAIKRNQSSVLAFIDLDKFKVVNDTSGHKAGDELLRAISQIFLSSVRKNDVVARLGGDEFGILLNGCQQEAALKVLESIRNMVDNFRFTRNNYGFHISTSIGAIEIQPNDIRTIEELFNSADTAAYIAKNRGGNQVVPFDSSDMIKTIRTQFSVLNRKPDKFFISFNNIDCVSRLCNRCSFNDEECTIGELIIETTDNENHHYEIVREIAERFSVAPTVDRWMVYHLFEKIKRHEPNIPRIVFIPLSSQTVLDHSFLLFLQEHTVELMGLNVCLVLSIDEACILKSLEISKSFITKAKRLGFMINVRNFGVGICSFEVLKGGDIDILTLKKNIIKDIKTDPICEVIYSSIIQISKKLNIMTMIELDKDEHYDIIDQSEINLIIRRGTWQG